MYQVEVKVLKLNRAAQIPTRATEGSAFYDVSASRESQLKPGLVTTVPTGLAFEVPKDYEMEIRPRSGLSLRKVFLANSPGTLDSDYRGELMILLFNGGTIPFNIRRGDRLAQIGIRPAPNVTFQEVESLPWTTRGQGGLGSTGR